MVGSGPGGVEGDRPCVKLLGMAEHIPQLTGHWRVSDAPCREWEHTPMLAMSEHVHGAVE